MPGTAIAERLGEEESPLLALLAIRCAIYNRTFKRVFDDHVAFQMKLLNI